MVDSAALDHDVWINWQRLNTAAHRERFDAGVRSRVVPAARVLRCTASGMWCTRADSSSRNGPVRDSHARRGWRRMVVSDRTPRVVWCLDAHAVATRDGTGSRAPGQQSERARRVRTRRARASRRWRTHVIVWRSRDTLKEEGDANYLMLRRDGTLVPQVRDYGEAGPHAPLLPRAERAVRRAARLHRVESHYEYSYRLLARVSCGSIRSDETPASHAPRTARIGTFGIGTSAPRTFG